MSDAAVMAATVESERAKYQCVWGSPGYRVVCHGLNLWLTNRALFADNINSAIDLGHGTARLVKKWIDEGIDGWGVDIAPNAADPDIRDRLAPKLITASLWDFDPPRKCDIGICADVLEHIPEEFVDATLRNIARSCETAYLKIACFNHSFDGQRLHMTVRPSAWWCDKIAAIGGHVDHEQSTHGAYDAPPAGCLLIWRCP